MTASLKLHHSIEHLLTPLQVYLNHPDISEIMINQPEEIWIEQSGQFFLIPMPIFSPLYLHRLFQLIANHNQQLLNTQSPLLSGNLPNGSRIQIIIPPAALYPTLAIRKKVVKHLSLQDYQDQNFYKKAFPEIHLTQPTQSSSDQTLIQLYQTQQWGFFIQQAILAKKNIVISGGTSSGKTTYLNACLNHIPHAERILILEDTREINTPHPNQVRLLATPEISMQTLLQASLRLRPDRIIMGEIRGKEILDFVAACSTGHEGCLTTIHANNPQIAFMRMTQMYKLNPVPSMTDQDILRELQSIIDIIIQINKTPEGRLAQGVYFKFHNHLVTGTTGI